MNYAEELMSKGWGVVLSADGQFIQTMIPPGQSQDEEEEE